MTLFASKTPRDLNRDPQPYVGQHGSRHAYPGTLNGLRLRRDPRPEFDHVQHNEPNPILTDYRMDIARTTWRDRDPLAWMSEAASPDTWPGVVFPYSPGQMDHARRVLERLARFSEGA